MHAFPHQYTVSVNAGASGTLSASGENTPELVVAPPLQFDGPGDQWSPEELLVAAVANCFVLSFRAITKASQFDWLGIQCSSVGTLDKVDRTLKFSAMETRVELTVPAGTDTETAEKLLHKAERTCLVSNSLDCEKTLHCSIVVG